MAIDTAPFSRRRPGDTTCCPLNATPQRPATASPPTDGNTTDFYGPINLAKALTSRDGAAPWIPEPQPVRWASSKFAVLAVAKGKQKLTISQLRVEKFLSSASESATTMRSTALTLFRSSELDHAVADLQLEVEDFLAKVAV